MTIDLTSLKSLGQVAGIGGIALGVLTLVFRDIIRRKLFPMLNRKQGFIVMCLIIVLTWLTAIAGLGAWVYTSRLTDSASSPSATGWIYIGTLVDGAWKTEGFGKGPTIATPPLPKVDSVYQAILDVNVRKALPVAPNFEMTEAVGIIRHGSRVRIDEVATIQEKQWVWARITVAP